DLVISSCVMQISAFANNVRHFPCTARRDVLGKRRSVMICGRSRSLLAIALLTTLHLTRGIASAQHPIDRGPWQQRDIGDVGLAGSATERSEEHTSELQSRFDLVCRLLLEKKNLTRPQPRPRHSSCRQSRHS